MMSKFTARYLDGPIFSSIGGSMVNIGLLARTDSTIDLRNDLPTQQFEKDHPSAGVHDLFCCGTIRFILATDPKN